MAMLVEESDTEMMIISCPRPWTARSSLTRYKWSSAENMKCVAFSADLFGDISDQGVLVDVSELSCSFFETSGSICFVIGG